MRSLTKDYSNHFPITSIEDDYLINAYGEVTVGYDLILPEVYTLSENKYVNIHQGFINTLKLLPVGSRIHKQDFFFLDNFKANFSDEKIIDRENLKHYNGRTMLKHYSRIYITFSYLKTKKSNSSPFLKAAEYIFGKPFDGINEKIEKINEKVDMIHTSLNSIDGIKAFRLKDSQLGNALYEYFNLSYDEQTLDYTKESLPNLEYSRELKMGNKYVKVLSLKEEGPKLHIAKNNKSYQGSVFDNDVQNDPSIALPTSLTFPIGLGLPVNHILNTIISLEDNQTVFQNLEIEKRKINILASMGRKQAQLKKDNILKYVNSVQAMNYTCAKVAVNIVIANEDFHQLRKDVNVAVTAFMNMNSSRCIVENGQTGNIFFESCPGNAQVSHRGLYTILESACCYIHKESQYYSDQSGYLFVDRCGDPIIIDLWGSKKIVNRNGIVIGQSGTGKSFNLNYIMNQAIFQKNHVTIMDVGHSYKQNCKLNNGKYFDSGDKKNLSFNIFLCAQNAEGKYLYISSDDKEATDDKITFIYSVLIYIWKGKEPVKQETKAILKKIINCFYDEYINERNIFPTLIEFNKYIDIYNKKYGKDQKEDYFDYKSFKLLLEPYVSGQYKHLLNSKENIDIVNDNFIVFDLESILKNQDVFPIVSIIIIELIIQKTNNLKGVKQTFLIDEGLDFLSDEKMGDFIAYLYRTFRKKFGQVILAAQNVNFIRDCPPKVKESLLANMDIKILLNHTKFTSSYKDLVRELSLSEHDIKLLDSIRDGSSYREFFLKLGNDPMILRTEVSDFAYGVYTSSKDEVLEIEDLYNETGSLITALSRFADKRKLVS